MATEAEVVAFLNEFKRASSQDGLQFVPRQKTIYGLAALGILIPEAERILLGLTALDYCKGSSPDEGGQEGDVWEFGVLYETMPVYLKIKVQQSTAKCLSFHPAEFPMNFPLKDKR